ncbi:hypothetical protein B2G71_18935 [Novosphingobium sp. PC22D]|uniref:DUF2059 domain-containing protein n=1 Tax=Novosphingobium sp. PC22D TaxID=1962403 RepID=UPI000BEF57FE|nr:DUF2059 domain-containing protein [Novosphingobium sp. PC22D]PEQ11115.1 hypothetical protein B2G71_18935 [Novosphingobium sp. PC22D]
MITKAKLAALAWVLAAAAASTAAARAETPAAVAPTDQAERLALAHEIIAVAFPPERREAMLAGTMNAMLKQMRAGAKFDSIEDAGLRKIVSKFLDSIPARLKPVTSDFLPLQMDAIAGAYTRMFTLEELRDVATFARSPSGRTYLQRSMETMSDPAVAQVNTRYFEQVGEITKQGQKELMAEIMTYLEEHPEAAPKTDG